MGYRSADVKRALLRLGVSREANLEQVIRHALRELAVNKHA
jgi:hypothetical protein